MHLAARTEAASTISHASLETPQSQLNKHEMELQEQEQLSNALTHLIWMRHGSDKNKTTDGV